MALLKQLQRFDAFPKMQEDFRVKTTLGAAVSLLAMALIAALFLSEVAYFLSVDVDEELFVDTSRNEKMRINLDIDFPRMPCAYLSLDVMDVSGENELDVDHDIYKQRLSAQGHPIVNGIEKEVLVDKADAAASTTQAMDPNRCESCYGAETVDHQCCNTCEEVREAYRKKGWAFNNGEGIAQCQREGWAEKMRAQANEGCNIKGFVNVNKVAGNFHVAPGKSFQQHNVHIHDLQSFGREAMGKFNFSHVIKKLSFGIEYPGQINPLDGHSEAAPDHGLIMFQYLVKVVPTRYRRVGHAELSTNQYAVTMHQRRIDPSGATAGLPGVFVMYEISPIVVQMTETRRSFLHFLTGVCAIIGGVFTVAGMIDAFLYHGLRSLTKKQELGKLG